MPRSSILIINCLSKPSCQNLYSLCSMLTGSPVESETAVWPLRSKYYSVDVTVRTVGREQVSEAWHEGQKFAAVVVHCDDLKSDCFKTSWSHCACPDAVDIRLLVCDQLDDDIRSSSMQWCIENQFELIALNSTEEEQRAAEESGEKVGIGRIIEALQSHNWTDPSPLSTANAASGSGARRKFMDDDDSDEDDAEFEDLYEKFSAMIAKARELNGEERKDYAEMVATKFWDTLKGSESGDNSD